MSELVVRTSAAAEWLSLINEAEAAAELRLDEEMQSYLVFLLMRFTEKPELAAGILAVEYLQGMRSAGSAGRDQLRNVGDKCLLYSGLFPRRAERRRVKVGYFVDLGRSAYQQLSDRMQHGAAAMYQRLAGAFVPLMDILQTMRAVGPPAQRLDPLCAFDLWRDTGSQAALTALREAASIAPLLLIPPSNDDLRH